MILVMLMAVVAVVTLYNETSGGISGHSNRNPIQQKVPATVDFVATEP